MKLLIVNDCTDTETAALSEEILNRWVKDLSSELSKRKILTPEQKLKELSLVFLDEKDAKRLNWQHRSKDYATDVLSFATDDPEGLGELVLCPMVLKKQATENKHSLEREASYMILHGVLHLLGFDHEANEDEERKMMTLQDEIFEILTGGSKPAPKSSKVQAGKSNPQQKKVLSSSKDTAKKTAPKLAKTKLKASAIGSSKTKDSKAAAKKSSPNKSSSARR